MMGTKEDYIASLTPDVLLFAPGTGILYSNSASTCWSRPWPTRQASLTRTS
jgi:hypothetical protein